MLAWSNGARGVPGGGGVTYITNGRATVSADQWRNDPVVNAMNDNMLREFEYIMSYHTEG